MSDMPLEIWSADYHVKVDHELIVGLFVSNHPSGKCISYILKSHHTTEVERLEKRIKELERLLEDFIDQCDSEMSAADHRKKIASMDYHTSEEEHQRGRWHCAYDLREYMKGKQNV